MALQKPTAETGAAGRHAGRLGPSQAADQAGLAALTTTLLAGAVTGAVAGMIETREAMARDEPARERAASPNDAAEQIARSEPTPPGDAAPQSQTREQGASPAATDETMVAVARLPEAEQAATTGAGETANSGTPEAGIGAPAPTTATAGTAAATLPRTTDGAADGGEVLVPSAAGNLPAQDMTGSIGPAPASGLGAAVTSAIDQALARLDADLGRITESLAFRPTEIAASLPEKIHEAVSAGVGDATGHLENLSATLDETLSRTTDALEAVTDALPAALAIPVTLLGADADEKPADGLLSRLFDGDANPTAIRVASAGEETDTPSDGTQTATDPAGAGASPTAWSDVATPDLSGGIEAVRIGFAGQSYADAADAQDGPAGAHGNLLHGLL